MGVGEGGKVGVRWGGGGQPVPPWPVPLRQTDVPAADCPISDLPPPLTTSRPINSILEREVRGQVVREWWSRSIASSHKRDGCGFDSHIPKL